MNHLAFLLRLPIIFVGQILFGEPTFAVVRNSKLTAINHSSHSFHFYQQISNGDPPSELDPALTNASVRRRICEDITNSGFFNLLYLDPINNIRGIRRELKQPEYSDLYRQIYRPTTKSWIPFKRLLHPYEYANSYTHREFEVVDPVGYVRTLINEHVFACLLRSWLTEEIFSYYVSKEYNVFGGDSYMAGRFVFGKTVELHGPSRYDHVLLAEEPAIAFTRSDYSVELHYLEIRKYRQPAESKDLDPICRVIPRSFSNNQSYRLCVEIFRSAYFRDTIMYPIQWMSFDCLRKEVSFRTEEAQRRAAGRSYFELMIRCDSVVMGNSVENISVYVSRSYRPSQVFVYAKSIDLAEGGIEKVYLETLFTNVGVVDESIGFDDVE